MKPSIEALCHVIRINRSLRVAAKVLSWLLIIGIISSGILIKIHDRAEFQTLLKDHNQHLKELIILRKDYNKLKSAYEHHADWSFTMKYHPEQAHKKILIDKRMRLSE